MNMKRTTLWVAIATLGMGAGSLKAQDEYGFEDESAAGAKPVYQNFVELGAGYTWDGNGKFGEYTSGLNDAFQDDGGFPFAGFRWSGGDTDTATRWDVKGGSNFGRLLSADYREQGNFAVGFYADQVEKFEYGDALTVFPGDKTTLTLPDGFVTGATGSPSLRESYGKTDIASKRKTYGIDLLKDFDESWTATVDFRRQEKTGTDVIAANQGFRGTALVPEPLDYDMQEMTGRVEFHTASLQNGFELYYSQFEHGNDTLTFQNPSFSAEGLDYEQLDLEPDNELYRASMDGGYTFNPTTRLSWFADWSRGKQDDNFVPPVLSEQFYFSGGEGQEVLPLPVSSLDGEVERTALKLSLVGRPFSRFDYRAVIDYKDKDATHDPALYQDVHYSYIADTYDWSSKVYDKESTTYSLEGGYRFMGGLRLRAGYEFETIDRGTEEFEYETGLTNPPLVDFTDTTDEDRYWAELKLPRLGSLSVKLRAEHNDRSADLSDERQAYLDEAYDGLPIRATPVFLLDREEDHYKVDADYLVTDRISLSGSYEKVQEDFDNDTNGLQSRDSEIWNFGLSWSPSRAFAASAYVSLEDYEIEQEGRVYSPSSSSGLMDSDWRQFSEDNGDGFGVSLDWAVIEDKLDLSIDLSYLDYDSDYRSIETFRRGVRDPDAGESLPSKDELTRLTLRGDYHLNARVDITGRYVYERRDAEGWSWDPTLTPGTATLASTLVFGWDEPDYDSHLFIISARYKF